jgi:hypothetical protein
MLTTKARDAIDMGPGSSGGGENTSEGCFMLLQPEKAKNSAMSIRIVSETT